MRRLWAYIIVVFAAVVAVFASFPSIMKGVSTNGLYETRREFTFQLTERVDENSEEPTVALEDDSAKKVADVMRSRLEKYNVSSFDVSTSGKDIVTVSFAANSKDKYQQIVQYLSFSGSFALVNVNNDYCVGSDFLRGNAYTKNYEVNEYPTVIIPVNTESAPYKALIEGAWKNPVPKNESSSDDSSEEETETVARIYLLYDWHEGEYYDELVKTNRLEEKTLMTFDFTADESVEGLYYDSNKNSFSQVCGFMDSNKNGVADPEEVAAAYDLADYYVNLFSASAYDYEIKCIRGLSSDTIKYLEAKIEPVLDANRLVWNRTLTALIAAIVIITLLLAYFYKLGAVSTLATTLATAFFAILIMVQTGLEYNALAVVAIIMVALVSIVSNIIYLNKFKEDCYKGHTIKKANTEASKKSLLPIADMHFVTLIVGIMTYVLGGVALRSFGAILAISSVISFIINTLGLKGLMWLSTNATAVNGKYELFAINKENVPDHMAEEKQTFYGTYAEKNITKHKKSVSIIAGLAFILGVVGIIVASSTRGGNLFKSDSAKHVGGELYVQNRILVKSSEDKSPLDDVSLKTILNDILIQKKAGTPIDQSQLPDEKGEAETYYTLEYFVNMDTNVYFNLTEYKVENSVTNEYRDTYFVLNLKSALKNDAVAEIRNYPGLEETTLDQVFEQYFETTSTFSSSTSSSLSLKQTVTVVPSITPKWEKVVLGSVIAVLIITVYLLLRYRLTRGLASIVFPVVASTITIGLMLLINLLTTVPGNAIIAVPVVTIFTYFFSIQFFNKEREMIIEDKVKDNSEEHRVELAKRALGIAFTPILATAVLGVYSLINFFGFGTADMSIPYAMMFVGVIITLGITSILLVPLCNLLFKLFSKVKIARKPKEGKKSKKPVRKSAEPEEAIFIGIND